MAPNPRMSSWEIPILNRLLTKEKKHFTILVQGCVTKIMLQHVIKFIILTITTYITGSKI